MKKFLLVALLAATTAQAGEKKEVKKEATKKEGAKLIPGIGSDRYEHVCLDGVLFYQSKDPKHGVLVQVPSKTGNYVECHN